ncbi:MAG: acetyltransferase [Cyanobacteriota bacterium]|nr:acetyltransferase [Cyanobacteriota bacterium]
MLFIGASGHAHSILSLLSRHGGFSPVGLIDSFQTAGSIVHGLPVLGQEADVSRVCRTLDVQHLVIAIGDNYQRQAMTFRLMQSLANIVFPPLVDPTAVVAADAQLGPGVVVMAQAHVGAGCVLEMGALINTQASLDHDGHLGAFGSLAPGAITGGRVSIGSGSFIGLGARLIQGVQVGQHTVVGAGSLVLHDLPDAVLAYGTPARVVCGRQPDDTYL